VPCVASLHVLSPNDCVDVLMLDVLKLQIQEQELERELELESEQLDVHDQPASVHPPLPS
jgi:hypothetical protein